MGSADFWNNQESAQQVVQQVKTLKNWVEPFEGLSARIQSARELSEMLDVLAEVKAVLWKPPVIVFPLAVNVVTPLLIPQARVATPRTPAVPIHAASAR